MKHKLIWISVLLVGMPIYAEAGNYLGLEPGLSTKQDAIEALGTPIEELVPNERYAFDAAKQGVNVLMVVLAPQTEIIKSIEVHPPEQVHKEKYHEWFELFDPFEREFDKEGNLIEYYLPHGISLHYAGKDDTAAVFSFTHFDTSRYEQQVEDDTPRPYIGIVVGEHTEEGFLVVGVKEHSPAMINGIQKGDIILEVGNHTFYEKELDPTRFTLFASTLSIGEYVRFLLMREGKMIETFISAVTMTEEQLSHNLEESYTVFAKGQFLLNNGDVYGACDLFKHAIWLHPYEPVYHSALGDAYYRIGLVDFAIEELEKAVTIAPHRFGYFLLGTIYLRQEAYELALEPLQKTLALGPPDIEVLGKLGYCYYQIKQYTDALEMYQRSLQVDEDLPIATFYVASCYDKLEDVKQALSFYKRYLAFKQANPTMNKRAEERIAFLESKPTTP